MSFQWFDFYLELMFVTAGVLKHAQTRGHGRERGAAAHDVFTVGHVHVRDGWLLYTSPSPRDEW